jgi:hypothetical protein
MTELWVPLAGQIPESTEHLCPILGWRVVFHDYFILGQVAAMESVARNANPYGNVKVHIGGHATQTGWGRRWHEGYDSILGLTRMYPDSVQKARFIYFD